MFNRVRCFFGRHDILTGYRFIPTTIKPQEYTIIRTICRRPNCSLYYESTICERCEQTFGKARRVNCGCEKYGVVRDATRSADVQILKGFQPMLSTVKGNNGWRILSTLLLAMLAGCAHTQTYTLEGAINDYLALRPAYQLYCVGVTAGPVQACHDWDAALNAAWTDIQAAAKVNANGGKYDIQLKVVETDIKAAKAAQKKAVNYGPPPPTRTPVPAPTPKPTGGGTRDY